MTDSTTTTTGSIHTDGGLGVAKDCIFGNDVKLKSDGAILSLGDGADFAITHDGTTGATIGTGATGLTIDLQNSNTGTSLISLNDNVASALDITQSTNSYLKFVTTNSSESIVIGQNWTAASKT